MPSTIPRSLRELSVWFIGSEELATSLRTVCDVEVFRPNSWRERSRDAKPAFLLVEGSSDAESNWGDELDRLLDTCRQTGIPRLLWFTESPIASRWLARCGRFDRIFAAELWQVPELEAAGAREPTTLWPATALPLNLEPCMDAHERPNSVVWLGGWNEDWPALWRERLASVLRGAAKRGLRILPAADLKGLPTDLRMCVETNERIWDKQSALRRAKVVIGADAVVGSPTFIPGIVFDAAACGTAVLTSHDFAGIHEFGVGKIADGSWRNMIPIVHDGDITVEEIDRLLETTQYRVEVVSHLRRIVAYNHTYGHRVATLASAAGYKLLHDANDSAFA